LLKSFEPACETQPAPTDGISSVGETEELSFAQQRLWFLDQLQPGRATYAIPIAMALRGTLDVPRLERAFASLVRRHESLRTVFVAVDGEPRQLVAHPEIWKLPVTDLSAEGDFKARERADELLMREVRRGFDLTLGPLFRVRLYKVAEDDYVLLMMLHHIVADGWSMGILFRELSEAYECCAGGKSPALLAPSMQYRDFVRWQRKQLHGDVLERMLTHWRSQLVGAPLVLELPADRPRPVIESNRGAIYRFTLPRELIEDLRGFALSETATLFMPLLTGFAALLSLYSREKNLLIGTPVANRNRAEFEGVVGCFVNTLVLRADFTGDPTVREALRRIRQVCLDALQCQDLPFERLVEELQPERDLSRNPLVQVMLSLENQPFPALQLDGLQVTSLPVERESAQLDLSLRARETPDGLSGRFEYSKDLFDEATIARLAMHWRSLLEAMAALPQARLADLPMLAEPERRQLFVDWCSNPADYAHKALVHELFEEQAAKTPEATAVSCNGHHFTYAGLDRRANELAHRLRQIGVGPGARVGLCVERSLDMVAGLLGILKTGAAYVPLDPAFPRERLAFMVENAETSAVLSQRSLRGLFQSGRSSPKLICVDDAPSGPGSISGPAGCGVMLRNSQFPHPDSNSLLYLIYTSGSTGRPKGVPIQHRAAVNLLSSMAIEPGLSSSDVLVAVTTLSFDIAVLEILLPITVGARVVVASQDQAQDGHALAALLEEHHATVMQATPITWRMLLESGWSPRRRFKALVGGEALPKELAEQLLGLDIELWNMYGPSETTVWSTCARITDTSNGIVIGKPIANTIVRILDSRLNACPIGVPGELFIGGDGLSPGYWNLPTLTAERFVSDPFSSAPYARLYRTGDCGRWRADGNLEHLGRLDRQIKLRGFRIEPGEIETVIARHPAVSDVAVLLREDNQGERCLAAYLVASDAPRDLFEELRARLRAVLPEYMVPASFVVLGALPRLPNGKLNPQALPPPESDHPSAENALPPRTATESLVLDTFRKVLGRMDIGILDSFFDLGGHSLMAARIMAGLRNSAGMDLPLRLLFERPTPARLAEAVDGLRWLEKIESQAQSSGAERREESIL
jgi:amino acid adenylation domain-containing protein